MTWVNDTILIQGEEIEIRRGKIAQQQLKFFLENPRLYSVVRQGEEEPDQEMIESRLKKMDHVKELVQSIKENGGLMEPIFVHEGTKEVLEGNSRLAAYRRLAEFDPIKWSEIKCVLLPCDFEKGKIFAFLGQLHIVGKKDWAPFEQAGFLYRRHVIDKRSIDAISKELNIPESEIRNLIKTYEYMQSVGDTDMNKWSYYFEMKKSRKIASICNKNSGFEKALVKKIKSGEIKRAVEVRDLVPKLANAKSSVLNKFINDEIDLEDAVERIVESGSGNSTYLRLKRFRDWFVSDETETTIASSEGNERNRIEFEIKQIAKRTNNQLKKLE